MIDNQGKKSKRMEIIAILNPFLWGEVGRDNYIVPIFLVLNPGLYIIIPSSLRGPLTCWARSLMALYFKALILLTIRSLVLPRGSVVMRLNCLAANSINHIMYGCPYFNRRVVLAKTKHFNERQ